MVCLYQTMVSCKFLPYKKKQWLLSTQFFDGLHNEKRQQWLLNTCWWLLWGLHYPLYRRKFKKWNFRQYGQLKSRGEKSQKRKDQKKEDADARKGRKVAKYCVFSNDLWLRRVEKVGSLKRRVRSQLATGAMKNCTPLWREAHFWSQNVQKHTMVGPLLEVAMSKKCMPLWREAHFQVKM